MKKIALLALAAIVAISCNDQLPNGSGDDTSVTIAGKITAVDTIPVPEQLTVYVYNDLAATYDEIEVAVDENGSFSTQIEIEKAMTIAMYGDYGTQLVVQPSDSIVINTNSKFEDIKFNDPDNVNAKLGAYKKNNPIEDLLKSGEGMAPESYDQLLDSALVVLKKYNTDFTAGADDPIMETIMTSEELFFIPAQKLMYTLFTPQGQLATKDSLFMEEVANLPEYKQEYVVNSNYPNLALSYYDYYLSSSAIENTDDARDVAFMEGLDGLKNNDHLRNQLIYRKTMTSLEDNNLAFYENHHTSFNNFLSENQRTSLASKHTEVKQLLESPELPEDATLLTFNTDNPEKYIDEIIANANGKVIYIDNWATWCGPCKAEFKSASPELHEKFKDDVEFVYLCHQSKEDGYLPSISKYQIAGKHYFLERNESTPIFKQINLEGFPTYTIINKKGEIVQSDYIHRPSYPKTSEILTELINE